MDNRFRDILDGLPEKQPRSRLERYRELIAVLRRRGRTYLDISQILAEKCDIQVTASGIHDFVRRRMRTKKAPAVRRPSREQGKGTGLFKPGVGAVKVTPKLSSDDVQQKIAALKSRRLERKPAPEKFQFDPDEPLHLKKPGKNPTE
jgi:hypothetical protein